MSRLDRVKELVAGGRRQLDAAGAEAEILSARLSLAELSMAQWQEAGRLLQEAAAAVQEDAHGQIAGVVTRCLEAVFPDACSFHVEFDRKRGKAEARLFFRQGGNDLDPMDAGSLGMVDVASFALRLACLKLMRPEPAQVLILDEPMKFLSRESKRKMASLLQTLSEEMSVQIVCVSHDAEFKVGNVIEI